METDEFKIIANIQKGEISNFSALYELYNDRLYRFIYFRTHHKQTAEDLTSVVFMKALENMGSFNLKKGQFSSWLYQIARNAIIDHFRTLKPAEDLENAWDISSGENIERDVEIKFNVEKVQEYLKGLSAQQRDIVIMRVWDGLSHKEISLVLGISEANSKMIFSRTLAKLQKEVSLALLMLMIINTK